MQAQMRGGSRFRGRVNVGQDERIFSMIAGGLLVLKAMLRPSRLSLVQALGGGYLLYRGAVGHCVVYELLQIERTGGEGVRVEHAQTVNRPRQEVYAFWRRLENLPAFMKHLEAVEITGDRTSHWRARAPLGRQVEWDAEITSEKENESLSWRSLPGSTIDHAGMVRFGDAPGGRGTEVLVTLRYDPPLGSASAAVARMFGEEPDVQIREDLRRFKQILEAGEIANTFGQTSGRAEEVEAQRGEIQRRRSKDIVEHSSEASFPASDAPAWTTGSGKAGEG